MNKYMYLQVMSGPVIDYRSSFVAQKNYIFVDLNVLQFGLQRQSKVLKKHIYCL